MTQPSPTPKGEETSPSPWTENVTQHSPDKPKAATSEWYIQRGQHRSGLPWYFEGPILYKVLERNYKIDREFHHPTGWFFTRKTRRNSREFFFWPFFSVLRVFAPHAPQTQRIPERYIATTSLWPPRVASETPRGAYASLKIRYAKFSRPKLAKASPEGKPRIQPTCHNFGPPALRSKRCVAPMLRQIFRSQKFRGATLEEEGSKGQPWKKKVPTASREWSQRNTIFGHPT